MTFSAWNWSASVQLFRFSLKKFSIVLLIVYYELILWFFEDEGRRELTDWLIGEEIGSVSEFLLLRSWIGWNL